HQGPEPYGVFEYKLGPDRNRAEILPRRGFPVVLYLYALLVHQRRRGVHLGVHWSEFKPPRRRDARKYPAARRAEPLLRPAAAARLLQLHRDSSTSCSIQRSGRSAHWARKEICAECFWASQPSDRRLADRHDRRLAEWFLAKHFHQPAPNGRSPAKRQPAFVADHEWTASAIVVQRRF